MARAARTSPKYFAVLSMLEQALVSLDDLDEGIAAAHLSAVIDLLAERLGERGNLH